MPVLVRDGRIAADEWTLVDSADSDAAPPERAILPLAVWRQAHRGAKPAGVWIDGDQALEDIAEEIVAAPLIAVRFAAFADGRGLSLGALLRSRYGFEGELRAFGAIVPDLTVYMRRCGFSAFVLDNERDADAAIACTNRISDHYQASVQEPAPPFRRG